MPTKVQVQPSGESAPPPAAKGRCCGGSSEEEIRSKQIDAELKQYAKEFHSEVKLLLLGTGESGKSTIAKQMKIIHQDGFSEEERKGYIPIIYSNMVTSMKVLIEGHDELNVETPIKATDARDRIKALDSIAPEVDKQTFDDLKTLWEDQGIQDTYTQSNKLQLNDSAKYYFDELDRIRAPDFIPTEQDVLRSRVKTTGIIETEFTVEVLCEVCA